MITEEMIKERISALDKDIESVNSQLVDVEKKKVETIK